MGECSTYSTIRRIERSSLQFGLRVGGHLDVAQSSVETKSTLAYGHMASCGGW